MIVLADTSPIRYLIVLKKESILPALYDRIAIPPAVLRGLSALQAPPEVQRWASNPPQWLKVEPTPATSDASLGYLGPGEREAIQLAQLYDADLLLIDERIGAEEAKRRGLEVTGTLGTLLAAAELGLIDLHLAVSELFNTTNFRMPAASKARFMALHRLKDR